MPAHQCPRCQLMFSFRTEVEYHVATDHRPTSPRSRRVSDEAKDAAAKPDETVGAAVRVRT